jgi:antitoxin ParD1/3/4
MKMKRHPVDGDGSMPRRTIELTERHEQLVERALRSGRYGSAGEVVGAGLRLLERQEEEDALRLGRLRQEVTAGFAAVDMGDYVEIGSEDLAKLIAELGLRAGAASKRDDA